VKRVLVVGHIWPYHSGAGNFIHAAGKYLPEFGWEPIVLTLPLPENTGINYQVTEVPYKSWLETLVQRVGFNPGESVKRQVTQKLGVTGKKTFLDFVFLRLREVLTYPDQYRGWQSLAIDTSSRVIASDDIKAIISDCPPISGLIVSKTLKVKHRLPWLVYFSHLWSQNNGYPYSNVRKWFETRLEMKTLSQVDVMITHSEPLVDKLKVLHRGKRVLFNFEGYDPTSVNNYPDKLTDKFTITYTGSFAPGLREPTSLLAALNRLLSRGVMERDRVEVRFYGTREIWIDSEIKKQGLDGVVKQYGQVAMPVAQAKQRQSQVLFNPKWDDPLEPGIYSGKIFEYLAARRPILAIGKYRDVVDDLLADTSVGVSALTDGEIESALEGMYHEYLQQGEVAFRGDTSRLDKLSHRELAERFAQELDRLI